VKAAALDWRMDLSDRAFAELVREALGLIPAEFRPYLENISVVIEEEPADDLLDAMEVPPDETLFGLYSGTPLPDRSHDTVELPERITLFRGPLLDSCDTVD
jgi:predicted Zn-dependent protease with MMP-like domain